MCHKMKICYYRKGKLNKNNYSFGHIRIVRKISSVASKRGTINMWYSNQRISSLLLTFFIAQSMPL